MCGAADDKNADEKWEHLRKKLLPLVDDEGKLVWASPIVASAKDWLPLVTDIISDRLMEQQKKLVSGNLDEDAFCAATK